MDYEGTWPLFEVPGFDCKDLQPSLAQAWEAMNWAKNKYRNLL